MKTLTTTDFVHLGGVIRTPEGEIGSLDEDKLLGKHPIPGRTEPENEEDESLHVD